MPKFGGRTRLISVGGVVLAGLITVLGVVIFGRAAGAHTADLTGTAACQNDGTFTITYTVNLTNSDLNANVTRTGMTPSGTTLTPDGLTGVAGNHSYTLTQSGIPNNAGTASLNLHVEWTDGVTSDPHTSVNLPNDCQAPPTEVTATAPTTTEGTCLAPQASYLIPEVTGVDYQVNGKTVPHGPYDVNPGDTVTVTAVAQQGYVLKGDKTWSHTFATLPTDCAGTPSQTQPSCTSPNGTYTVPSKDGVTYLVDNKPVKAGTYPAKAGSTVTITAVNANGQPLPGTSSWTLKFDAAPTDCNAHVPTFVDNTCTLTGSYTIPNSTADYTVNGVAVTPGKHSVTAGSTITVKAIAQPGHPLTGTTSWTHTFPNLPQCVAAPPHVGSGQLPNTGPDVPVGKASLLAGLLALIGGAMLFAGRRPRPVKVGRHSVS